MPTADAPFFSIISCARNAGAFARRSIESVLAQTERSWQLYFIDDASDDDTRDQAIEALPTIDGISITPEFSHHFSSRSGSHIVFRQCKQRRWKLQNFLDAVSCADGTVLVELDGDDFFATPDALATIRAAYASSPYVDATVGSHQNYPEGVPVYPATPPARGYRLRVNGFANACPAPRTWRREFTLRSLRDYPDCYTDPQTGGLWRYNADLALFAPAAAHARLIAPIDDILVHASYVGPHHDYLEAQDAQRDSGLRLFEYWRAKEVALNPPGASTVAP